jgi:hypothetical protein
LFGHGSITFNPEWNKPIDIKGASIYSVLTLTKVGALKEPEKCGGGTMDPIEV